MHRGGGANEGYKLLPRKDQPVVMNTKGASAAGKSTLRPLQKKLAGEIGVDWSDFALVSPISGASNCSTTARSARVQIRGRVQRRRARDLDEKLDRYMARKAERGDMPHLLIDRFRFDSFAPHSDEAGSNLLTRFGHQRLSLLRDHAACLARRAAMESRARVGRYKAVDDTLGHSVDAYSGFPSSFSPGSRGATSACLRVSRQQRRQGERPRTIAFGTNDVLNVLDVRGCSISSASARRRRCARARAAVSRCEASHRRIQHRLLARVCGTVSRDSVRRSGHGRIYLHMTSSTSIGSMQMRLRIAASDPMCERDFLLLRRICSLAQSRRPRAVVSSRAVGFGLDPTLGQWESRVETNLALVVLPERFA
jgi:hypothetical protein